MEESVTFMMDRLREEFAFKDIDLRMYSPLTLAYIGDAIYDLIIRTLLVKRGNCQPNKLHRMASSLVRASAQEEETAVYKRGRNAKSYTMAKNATMLDYRKATGFEALMGYLYLKEDLGRMIELIKTGLDKGEQI